MASECRAKNPATCRTHGSGNTSPASNNEAEKKAFFGESVWENLAANEEDQVSRKVMREVSRSFTNSSQDIEGFTGTESEAGRKKIAEILINEELKDPSEQADSSAAVREVRQYFKDHHDSTNDGGPSALATVRLFKSLKRASELGEGIREEALLQAQKPAVTASFEARAEGIVSVLRKHGFMGTIDGKRMDKEQRYFISQIEKQVSGERNKKPVEIMYRPSDRQVVVWASMADGQVSIDKMQVKQFPYNSRIDEDVFAEDLGRIFNRTSYTKEMRSYPNGA